MRKGVKTVHEGFQIDNLIYFLRFDVKLVVSYGLHMIIMDHLHWRDFALSLPV
jgi:hypothetical protein